MKIALIQPDIIWENTRENLLKYEGLLADLEPGTEIVILPEVFDTGFSMQLENLEKPLGLRAFEWLQDQARSYRKIFVGSTLFQDGKHVYNRQFWMQPDGNYTYYDKRHLFQMGGEDRVIAAGKKRVVASYKNVNFMLQTCYDLRFPVWIKNRYDAQKQTYDYDVLVYIANWPEIRKPAYMALLKARAIENQAYVIWVNRVGTNNKNIVHTGDSQVIDPEGNTLFQMKEKEEGIGYATLDLAYLNKVRKGFQTALDWDDFELKP